MHKHERQEALIELLRVDKISRQGELVAKLTLLGFNVTQASVSRDLDELGIAKLNGQYTIPRTTDPAGVFGSVRFDLAGDSLIVGKCASGLASAITVRIDRTAIPKIVGTIAGDDTIFIAVKDSESQEAVLADLAKMFG